MVKGTWVRWAWPPVVAGVVAVATVVVLRPPPEPDRVPVEVGVERAVGGVAVPPPDRDGPVVEVPGRVTTSPGCLVVHTPRGQQFRAVGPRAAELVRYQAWASPVAAYPVRVRGQVVAETTEPAVAGCPGRALRVLEVSPAVEVLAALVLGGDVGATGETEFGEKA
ncbi:hypothetical protein GCM10012275_43150 [Longimycelium tulufanense]|uniref:Uncharacterized protein n=1 Tax=Longimycelium tulufanense TaxID=907463 RepID=A0A8J3CHG2_9PSEU|nr:hypothetical protein [Longimycelium tulufanense]GGM67947.1 hypothetical protein GCM10012275_43150 [Longimycelium tulufanense]